MGENNYLKMSEAELFAECEKLRSLFDVSQLLATTALNKCIVPGCDTEIEVE